MSAMEGVESVATEIPVVPAPVVQESAVVMEVDATQAVEEEEATKKRKENPVPEEEALEEASEGRPVRTKYARLATSVSPKSTSNKSMAELREEAREAREAERRQKEAVKEAEREAKRVAAEAVKRQKEAEKQKREDEKKAKEEEKRKKEEEKKAKEAEKAAAKEASEREKAAKEEERKRQKEAKEEEKRAKEEEKRKKEAEREEARQAKETRKTEKKADQDKAQESVKRQSNLLMSFFKKTPSTSSNTLLPEGEQDAPQTGAQEMAVDTAAPEPASATASQNQAQATPHAQFQRVGMFLEWIPPQGATIPRLQKWTQRSDEDAFEKSIETQSLGTESLEEKTRRVRTEFNEWRRGRSDGDAVSGRFPSREVLCARRRAQFSARASFQLEGAPSVEKQKRHMVENKVKFLAISESFRPTYFGTFTSTTAQVNGRRWRGKANELINYEIDSEEENFETIDEAEEADADDLEAASQGSSEGDEQNLVELDADGNVHHSDENEYQFDAFIVPDGHLSEDEAENRSDFDEDEDEMGDTDDLGGELLENGERRQKKKSAHGGAAGEEANRKRHAERAALLLAQTKKRLSAKSGSALPRLAQTSTLIGVVFDLKVLEETNPKMAEIFQSYSMRPLTQSAGNMDVTNAQDGISNTSAGQAQQPLKLPFSLAPEDPAKRLTTATGAPRKTTARLIPAALLPEIAQFIHKEWQASFEKLLARVRETFGAQASKKQLGLFIREKCEKMKLPTAKAGVWLVKKSYRDALALPHDDPAPPPPTEPSSETAATTANATSNHATPTKKTPKKKSAETAPSVLQYFAEPAKADTSNTNTSNAQ